MSTIVCGTDFSKAAAGAEAVARALASRLGHTVVVVNAQTEAPHEELIEAARGSMLLVIGSTGHREGTHWLIGSTAERVAQHCTIPLLVVRQPNTLLWAIEGERPVRVVVATDLEPESERVLTWAAAWHEAVASDVHIAYVANPAMEYARLGIDGPIDRRTPHPKMEEDLTRKLYAAAARFGRNGIDAGFTMTLGATSKELLRVAEEQEADLVVVGAHQRSRLTRAWQESVAHSVLHTARTNVAVIPLG